MNVRLYLIKSSTKFSRSTKPLSGTGAGSWGAGLYIFECNQTRVRQRDYASFTRLWCWPGCYHSVNTARTENAINEGARHAMAAETAAHPKIRIPTNMLPSPCDSLHICLELNVLTQLKLRKYLRYVIQQTFTLESAAVSNAHPHLF